MYRLRLSIFLACYPRHTALLASDNDVLAVNLFPNDDKVLLKCPFAEKLHVMAGLTIVGVLKVFILRPREENMTGGDPVKLVDAVDCHEEPNRSFSPGGVLSTYIHTEGGGEGLAYDCRGVDEVGGLKERGTGGLNVEVGFAQLDINILDAIAE